MAMRVENCWTGSEQNPIELIDHAGCSREETMISSPIHRHAQRMALSFGWLTVRLFNTSKIRLSCAIRLCDSCENECRKKIVSHCNSKWESIGDAKRRREETKELAEMCRKENGKKKQPTEQKNAGGRTENAPIGALTFIAITAALLARMPKPKVHILFKSLFDLTTTNE